MLVPLLNYRFIEKLNSKKDAIKLIKLGNLKIIFILLIKVVVI